MAYLCDVGVSGDEGGEHEVGIDEALQHSQEVEVAQRLLHVRVLQIQ